jgi:hypothetical protein
VPRKAIGYSLAHGARLGLLVPEEVVVHNHGAEEGRGLACNESRLPDGSLRGACMMDSSDLFRQFAGCKVDVTDENGNRIAVGTMDEHGLVQYEIDGVEHTQQLTRLVVGEE